MAAENCVRFRDVLLEFSRNLPVRSIFLYGQGGGGKFAAYFSVAFPALADGVLAHGTAIAENSAIKTTVLMLGQLAKPVGMLMLAYAQAVYKRAWLLPLLCVVGTGNGTRALRSGDIVRVDGSTGEIAVLTRSRDSVEK